MRTNTVLILAAIAVGGGLISVIAYHIARFMRGTIKLALPRTGFNPGDAIVGSFDLRTKTAIQGNKLFVSLIGIQVTTTREEGKATQTRRYRGRAGIGVVSRHTDNPLCFAQV